MTQLMTPGDTLDSHADTHTIIDALSRSPRVVINVHFILISVPHRLVKPTVF